MLLFSTVLSISKNMTKDDFIKLIIEWNQGSPHKTNIIPNIDWNGERNIRFGDEYLWLDIEEYRNKNIIAVRYEKCEADGVIWDTDYVMNFEDKKMSVRLDRSYTEEALMENPKFSTPHFISLLINNGFLEDDNDLPVLRTPYIINDENINIIGDVINGETKYRLPIVYISKTIENEDPVDVGRLAGRLKGVAHVLVQEDKKTNSSLRTMTNDLNEYFGAIGIYYPNQTLGHKRYLYRSAKGFDLFLLEKIISEVIQYNNAQMIDTLFTWQGVNNALLRDRLKKQSEEKKEAELAKINAEERASQILDSLSEKEIEMKRKAKDEVDTILEGFDDDMQRLQKQVEELTRVNEALQYENQGLKAKLDSNGNIPLLSMGDEYEFYAGEIKDIILNILSDSESKITPKSRRMDVVKDILRSNDYKKINASKAENLKRILKDYKGMTSRLRQELEEFGFVITEDGKHYKLTYYGDGRYSTIFAKTPSDGRSGKNNAMNIIRDML